MDASLGRLSSDRAEEVGMARFFRNPKVKKGGMLKTAAKRTAAAAAGRHVLILQDTSEINYQAKAERKRYLGKVGNGEDVGLFVHPALTVDAETGAALGLAGATIWRRQKIFTSCSRASPMRARMFWFAPNTTAP
jgi:hypothetical protein